MRPAPHGNSLPVPNPSQDYQLLSDDGDGFKYLRVKFPQLSEAKVKEEISVGPQITKLMKNEKFKNALNTNEKAAWETLEKVFKTFFGKKRA